MSDLSKATESDEAAAPSQEAARGGERPFPEAAGGVEDVEIVRMEREHLPAVLEIERRCFEDPWDEETFRSELRHSWSECRVLRRVEDGALLGYLVFWQVVDEVHLLNVAVNPDLWHRHYGRMMLEFLLDYGRRHRARFVTVEVRESNETAIRFYESAGLRRVGVRPRYDRAPGEDAVVMLYDLAQPPGSPTTDEGAGPSDPPTSDDS